MYAPNHYPSGRRNYCCDVKGIASAVSTLRSRQTLHRVRRSVSRKCFFFFFFFQSEWTIAFPFLLQLWQHWFRPMVDLFATRFNHRLDVNMSPVPDPAAWRVDTLSFSLSNLLSYASPPPFHFCRRCFGRPGWIRPR